jgi:hypothetical protein
MRLSPEDVSLFLKLYIPLSFFANQCNRVVDITTFEQFRQLPPEKRLIIRDSIFQNSELIDEFIKSNPEKFSDQELDMVSGFKNFMKGRFYLVRQLKKYAIFLTSGKEAKA